MSVHRRVYCVPRAYNTVEKEKQKKNYNAVSSARYIRVGGHICTVVVRVLYTHYAYGIPLRTTVYTIYLYTGRIICYVRGYKLYSTATVCRYCLHQCTLLRYCDIIICKRYRLRQLFAHATRRPRPFRYPYPPRRSTRRLHMRAILSQFQLPRLCTYDCNIMLL